jgi:hypothetical protein
VRRSAALLSSSATNRAAAAASCKFCSKPLKAEKVKRWKLAISLAVVAALAAPLVTGAWKLRPGGWHSLPVDERERIAKMATETENCIHFSPQDTEIGKAICMILLSDLHAGGRYESGEQITWRYIAKNLELMAEAFFFVFLAAMILPALGVRYWRWLKR